jgi:hypothetical protein
MPTIEINVADVVVPNDVSRCAVDFFAERDVAVRRTTTRELSRSLSSGKATGFTLAARYSRGLTER